MPRSRAKTCVPALKSSNPLTDASILQHVLDLVGPGHWLYIGTVCKKWYYRFVICSEARTTQLRYACASASRVRLAHFWKLLKVQDSEHHQERIGHYADTDALAAAHDCGMPWSTAGSDGAVQCGSLLKVQWLMEQPRACPLSRSACAHAAKCGNLEMLCWLRSKHGLLHSDVFAAAAGSGHLPTAQYLLAEACPWGSDACDKAASKGHLAMLQWLRERGCPWEAAPVAAAAGSSGSIAVLQWLQQQGVALTAEALVEAARQGHTAMCEFLRAQGCAFSSQACTAAATKGHLDTLKWLHEHGCPWNAAGLIAIASRIGSPYMLMYVMQAGGLQFR